MFQLTLDAVTPEDAIANRHLWPARITAVSTVEGETAKIFVYHAGMDITDVVGDLFECVASSLQMTELPEDAPEPGVPYYRKDVLELNCRHPDMVQELWDKVREDVQDLVDNLRLLNALSEDEIVTID